MSNGDMGLDINPPFLYKKIDSVHSLAVSAFQTSLQEAIATVQTVHFDILWCLLRKKKCQYNKSEQQQPYFLFR